MGQGTMDGCGKFMKYSLFIANFIILLGGVAVIAVGAITLHNQNLFKELIGDELYKSSSIVLIITGSFIMFFSFLGCFGAIKEIKCLLLTYFVLLLILFIVLLIGGVLGYVFKAKTSENIKDQMHSTLTKYKTDKVITSAWDNVQTIFQCCGIEKGEADWRSVGIRTPLSCCKDRDNDQCPKGINYQVGCFTAFKDGANIVGGVGVAVACLLLLGLIFSCGVFMSIT